MRKPDMENPEVHAELEKALLRLMPVDLSESGKAGIEDMLDCLAGDGKVVGFQSRSYMKWSAAAGLAAAAVFAFSSISFHDHSMGEKVSESKSATMPAAKQELPPELVFLAELDRVENMSDEGLYVDAGGSAMRKVRIRVVEESQVRDEETGIVVMLTEPREEMFLVPVSSF
ncbi:MAG: hypothetical protein H7Y36_11140 [Armatimonadetes bacterium]|nr:hypothetical protein [Akkermansiaceae bacterium]